MPVTQKWVHGGVFLTGAVLVLSIAVLILGAARQGSSDAGLPGAVAPEFTLKDNLGATVTSKTLDGKIGFVVFGGRHDGRFATVAPMIDSLVQTYATDSNVAFVALQYDLEPSILGREEMDAGTVQRSLGGEMPVLIDLDASAARAYRVSEEPVAFVIDQKGVIRHRIALNNESAKVLCSEAINSLRSTVLPGSTTGVLSGKN